MNHQREWWIFLFLASKESSLILVKFFAWALPREKRFFLAKRGVRQKEPLFFTQGNWLCIRKLHFDGRKNSCKTARKVESFCQNRRIKTGKRTCELLKLHECNLQITAETWKHLLPSRETILLRSTFFDALENSLQHF